MSVSDTSASSNPNRSMTSTRITDARDDHVGAARRHHGQRRPFGGRHRRPAARRRSRRRPATGGCGGSVRDRRSPSPSAIACTVVDVPATATNVRASATGIARSTSSSSSPTAARIRSRSAAAGGSPRTKRSVSRTLPICGRDRGGRTLRSPGRTRSSRRRCRAPGRARGASRPRVAPRNESRASSSPLTISSADPASSRDGRLELVRVRGVAHRGRRADADPLDVRSACARRT